MEVTRSGHVVIGVDTHKYIHVAAAMDSVGGILATLTIATDSGGFAQLVDWASSFGQIIAFGIEGTGSHGGALTSYVRRQGFKVIEVSRADRRLRRLNGKSDTLDAENAARAVLAGFATAIPKTADGTVEMIRQLKVAHDTAVKGRAAGVGHSQSDAYPRTRAHPMGNHEHDADQARSASGCIASASVRNTERLHPLHTAHAR